MSNEKTRCVKVSSRNPRYFEDAGGRIVYLAGSHSWPNFKDMGETDPPRPFDFDAYLRFLIDHNHNFFRLWAMELPHSPQGHGDTIWYRHPFPWPRTGPGVASDGKPRFDLSRFEDGYFDRMRTRVQKAAEADIVVAVMVFDGYGTQFNRTPTDGFPFSAGNNINGVESDGKESQSLSNDAVTRVQEAYARRVIQTVNDLPNVIYEIANEAGAYSARWQYHMIDFIRRCESSMPLQHPVGITFLYEGGTHRDLAESSADWISPGGDGGYGHPTDPPAADGSKVIINDTDHSLYYIGLQEIGPAGWSRWAWSCFTRGHNLAFMDPYMLPWPGRNNPVDGHTDSYWEPMRHLLGTIRRVANELPLAEMVPAADLSSTGYCLSNRHNLSVVYIPEDVAATARGLAAGRPVTITRIDPTRGARVEQLAAMADRNGNVEIPRQRARTTADSVVIIEGK